MTSLLDYDTINHEEVSNDEDVATDDFTRLYRVWWDEGGRHTGIVVSRQLSTGELLRRTLRLLETATADEIVNSIRNLAEFASRHTEER